MSVLLNSLLKKFPHEQTAFGDCVIVPSRSFNPEWEQQLKGEGHKVFVQAWNGEASFFVPVEKSVTIQKTNEKDKHNVVVIEQLKKPNSKFRTKWTQTEADKLKEFFDMRLGPSEIAHKLDRTRGSILGKMQRLGLRQLITTQPTNTSEPYAGMGDNIVKEYLACVSELYPRYPHVCSVLLKEAASKILVEKREIM